MLAGAGHRVPTLITGNVDQQRAKEPSARRDWWLRGWEGLRGRVVV
ncbi:hypothetical protein [Amycolatopsis sp. H20-H5]|nr:hypothetical protein [Amycolatopsis sp. H20-H5]MEC3982046.1 hypothetical protein [Amycolatopsis sp. H20-H5]